MRLYVYSGKLILAAMYFRRVEINGRSYAAAPTKASTVVTPHAPAANVSVEACGGLARQMCSGKGLILIALYMLWQVSPRSDGANRTASAAQNLGVDLLVTALAHLRVRNLARRFDGLDTTTFFRRLFLIKPNYSIRGAS